MRATRVSKVRRGHPRQLGTAAKPADRHILRPGRVNSVVPFAVKHMGLQVDERELGVRDATPRRIDVFVDPVLTEQLPTITVPLVPFLTSLRSWDILKNSPRCDRR